MHSIVLDDSDDLNITTITLSNSRRTVKRTKLMQQNQRLVHWLRFGSSKEDPPYLVRVHSDVPGAGLAIVVGNGKVMAGEGAWISSQQLRTITPWVWNCMTKKGLVTIPTQRSCDNISSVLACEFWVAVFVFYCNICEIWTWLKTYWAAVDSCAEIGDSDVKNERWQRS